MDLRPRQFRGEDLMEGLQRLVDEFRSNTDLVDDLTGPDDGAVVLPTSHATALFHICQEALANIAKHAAAHQASIDLWTAPGRALLEISDDGQGFDLRKMSVHPGSRAGEHAHPGAQSGRRCRGDLRTRQGHHRACLGSPGAE